MPDSQFTSARLFASFVADEPDAAAQLFHRYLRRLCRLAQTRLSPRLAQRIDAEDIVMSAYRSFFISAKAGRFWIRESGDLWALLTKITLRKLYRSAAHHLAEMRCIHREIPLPSADEPAAWILCEQPRIEDAVALADEVESVLRSLPEQQRRVLELRLQGELLADIAEEIGISERTVRRIVKDLEQRLRETHGLCDPEVIQIVEMPKIEEPPIAFPNADQSCNETSVLAHYPFSLIPFEDLLLQRLVGKGGMGKVYRAICRRTGQTLAVKFLHKSLQKTSGIAEQFLNEAAIVQSLEHPGIVRVEGLGKTNAGVYFIVMELIDGHSLADEMAIQHPSIPEAMKWIAQVGDAMQHAHQSGVMHCDLKPANILLNRTRNAIVSDFGLARLTRDAARPNDSIAGTAGWMAPEQIDPIFGPITHATDVYGLGALMYSLLTGDPPFSGRRCADVLAAVVSQQPVDLKILRPQVVQHHAHLCLKSLSKHPAHRPPSISAFLDAMKETVE